MGRSVEASADCSVRGIPGRRNADPDPGGAHPDGPGAVDPGAPPGPHDADPTEAGPDRPLGADPDEAGLGGAIMRAQRGDSEAFRTLYRDAQPRLLRYLHALVGDDAEDVASETWLQVTRDLATFTGDYDHFRGWITTIARHRALDHLRHQARKPPALPMPQEDLATRPAPDDTADVALEALSTTAALALINSLPADQAEAVLLRAVLGLDAASAAAVLGKRPGAVRTAAYRGLRTLASRLDAGLPGLTPARTAGRTAGRAAGRTAGQTAGRTAGRRAGLASGLTGDRRTRGIPNR
jgi:RNA polymerase sigma-70 factor, ECF subfamily